MKKLFTLFTIAALLAALFIVPTGGVFAEEEQDEGTEIINIDFSDPAIGEEFGVGWAGGWKIVEEKFHTTQAWESSYYKHGIENFGTKRIVITVDFFIAYTTQMPAFSFGVVDNPACIANDNYGPSGVTVRFFNDKEQLFSSFTGKGNGEWIMDSQWKFVVENPTLHTLEMTFDADKTVTVKVDGNVLSHSNGQRMYKVNYAEKHDFSVGYLAMKATEVETYVDNIRVVEYDTPIDPSAPQPPAQSDIDPTGDVSETPTEPSGNNGSGDVGGSTTPVKTGGCGSSIGAVSAISLVVAASLVLVFTKLRHLKK